MSQFNIKSEKTLIYNKYFAQCDVEKTDKVTISEANNLFRKSGLVIDNLNKIYKYCGANKYGFFGRTQFHNALEMISLAQAGVDVDENILKSNANYSLPRFDHEVNEAFKTVQKSHELPSSIPSTSSKHHMRTLSGNNISHNVPPTNWYSNSSSGNTLIEPEEGLPTVPTITGATSTAEAYKQIPVATPEQLKSYTNFFRHNILHNNNDLKVAGTVAISLFQMHNLSSGSLERILNLFNITPESELTFIEFCTALRLITHVEIGYEIPEILPENLLPAEFEQPDLSDDEVPADDGTTGSNFTDVPVNQAWDASSRKRSQPYNCLPEPIHSKKRNTFSEYNKEITRMPESGPGTEINSRQDSNEKPPQEIIKKYSIFRDDELLMIQEKSKYGQIVFSICYDLSAKVLEVTVNYAKYLLGYGTKRSYQYYVKVMLKTKGCTQYMSTNSLSGVPDKNVTKISKNIKGSFRTTIKSDFFYPIFDESFKFTNVTPTVLKECNLQFIIKEEIEKFYEKDLIIGCADFDLGEASLIWKYESIHGIIRELTPFEQMEDKGKVVLSLQCNVDISKLYVCVMRVICASGQSIDVSVEISLRSNDSIIVSKKVEVDYSKSGRIESFSFDSCRLGSLCLVFVFSARNRNCSKAPFGRLIIGPSQFANGARLAHWTEMCSANRNVIKTHDII